MVREGEKDHVLGLKSDPKLWRCRGILNSVENAFDCSREKYAELLYVNIRTLKKIIFLVGI